MFYAQGFVLRLDLLRRGSRTPLVELPVLPLPEGRPLLREAQRVFEGFDLDGAKITRLYHQLRGAGHGLSFAWAR